ncbi:MAG: alkane 1-monooxygenase [Saprospiraceae bacterium]|jgi:alkane 1-monooxygenase|nr:alkane 1-monooxygenase [Saprospiraceae bacterium]
MWKDAKYLLAYSVPLAAFAGLYFQGPWSPGSFYVAFVAVPVMEFFLPGTDENLDPEEEQLQSKVRFFDVLLYLNIPILYALMAYYFEVVGTGTLSVLEIAASTISVGLAVGSMGINVGHELGHRTRRYEQLMAKILLLPALYMHFFIEHNRGHHKNVATDLDPASARKGQTVYAFWVRSVVKGYLNAWQLEHERLVKEGLSPWSWHNQMAQFQVIQAAYLLLIGAVFGWGGVPYALAIAVVGFLLLETVNYVEHYGLRRRPLDNGRYEPVTPRHSWNSNHELGRILLYELTRHSDHHYKASRKYQILRHWDESPQLPLGYPSSIILSLVPPLWFGVMDRRVEEVSDQQLAVSS